MAQYPRIEHVFIKDLAEGDQIINLEVNGTGLYLSNSFGLSHGGSVDQVTFYQVISVSTALVSGQWLTALEVQSAGSVDGLQNVPSTLNLDPLTRAQIAVGDLSRLVP
jgi:hypothetical protein